MGMAACDIKVGGSGWGRRRLARDSGAGGQGRRLRKGRRGCGRQRRRGGGRQRRRGGRPSTTAGVAAAVQAGREHRAHLPRRLPLAAAVALCFLPARKKRPERNGTEREKSNGTLHQSQTLEGGMEGRYIGLARVRCKRRMLTLQLPVTSPAHGQLHRCLHTSAAVTGTWMGPTQVRNVVIITFAVSPVLSLQSHSLTFLSFSFLPKSPPTEWRCAGGRTGSPASCGLGEARPASRRLRSSPASYGLGELPGR
jgi:hypothetical protein